MANHSYQCQSIQGGETRLVKLLPGRTGTPVGIRIDSVRLEQPVTQRLNKRFSLAELQRTLLEGWITAETHQYQYGILFEGPDKSTSRDHPGLETDPASWETFPKMPPAGHEPKFGALSYVCGATELQDPSVKISVDGYDGKSYSREKMRRARCKPAVTLWHLRFEEKPRKL